ncbi:MAG TPA: protein kinase, partial [Myxococcales bacterium]|nr:protein kinase [Myxococcales bacterium]
EVLASRGPRGPLPEGNPYRGLQPFEAEHRALFFGRRQAIQAVMDRLRGDAFVALTGDSGVGKSSLCLAGVLPAVAEGQLVDKRSWQVARMVPGRLPSEALASALAGALVGVSEVVLGAMVREGPQAFVRRVRGALPPDRGVLLYVDQMEELVTLSAPEQVWPVAQALGELGGGVPGLKLLASTRSDFLTRLAALPGLGAQLPRSVFLVRALTVDELREAVQAPARMKGVRFESEALVNDLVAAAERAEGGLPLLQFALAELWEARDAPTQVITARSVEAIGGVGGALARHAEAVLSALVPEQRAAARAVLLRLVSASGTRARRSEEELRYAHPAARAALEALVRGRLVVAREADGQASYEVAHEAILTGCATLAGWLGEEAETKAARERLSLAAAEWERMERHRELLWGARSLEEVASVTEGLTPGERAFLEASRRAVRRRHQRRRAVAAAGVALLAGAGVLGWSVLQRQSELRGIERVARATLAQAREQAAAVSAQRAAAFRRFDLGQAEEAEKAWRAVQRAERELETRYGEATTMFESALAVAGPREDLRRLLGQAFFELALFAEESHRDETREAYLERMRANDVDGALEAAWTRPAAVTVSQPRGAPIAVDRYDRQPDGAFQTVRLEVSGVAPATLTLPPGSYRLTVGEALYPLLLHRGESRVVALPANVSPPPGFAFIPGGPFLFGSEDGFEVRQFLQTAPIHERLTGPYFLARHETTYAEWIEFLKALPPAELPARRPRRTASTRVGMLRLVPPS